MKVFSIAPDFTLPDLNGKPVLLSAYAGSKNIVLVFLRGFM
jgi:peroxiredoxin